MNTRRRYPPDEPPDYFGTAAALTRMAELEAHFGTPAALARMVIEAAEEEAPNPRAEAIDEDDAQRANEAAGRQNDDRRN